jgi:hypothetical protein
MLLLISRAVVGIATPYTLNGRGIKSRWKARLYAHIQNGPEYHPVSCEWVQLLDPVGKAARAWG